VEESTRRSAGMLDPNGKASLPQTPVRKTRPTAHCLRYDTAWPPRLYSPLANHSASHADRVMPRMRDPLAHPSLNGWLRTVPAITALVWAW
jgi:hypothetical protein